MNAAEAVRVAREFNVRTVIPLHYEGWAHFVQGRDAIESSFAAVGITDRVIWLEAGRAQTIDA